MIEFIVGVIVGFAAGVTVAIMWPDRWSKITKEASEELKR